MPERIVLVVNNLRVGLTQKTALSLTRKTMHRELRYYSIVSSG